MTRFSILACTLWFALCFFVLDGNTQALIESSLNSARPHLKDLETARVSFVLYSCVPVLLWLFETLRKESQGSPILHKSEKWL